MPAKSPTLDNRALNDILEQLQGLARDNVPEWHPPDEGDAGTMLQRIFARLLEISLERLNKVPEKNLLAFLDVMGVSLLPPSTAKVPLSFSLTPGNPATLVPKDTQSSTQTSGEQPAVIFETEDDLTVIPAQLTMGFAMDPAWDRCADQTLLLGGESFTNFTPFVGTKRMPHVLYIGDDALLNFSRETTVELKIEEGTFSQDEQECLKTLSWRCRSKGAGKTKIPTVGEKALQFTISDPIDQETVNGVGLTQGIQNRWLRGVLTTPLPDAKAAQDLRLKNLILKVSANNLLPDLAFSNTAPVDVTKDFLPFGEAPKMGDTFYIASMEALSKVGPQKSGKVIVDIKVKEDDAQLSWEYWTQSPTPWKKLENIEDETDRFTNDGTITFALPDDAESIGLPTPDVVSYRHYVMRVSITGGGYQRIPSIRGFGVGITTEEEQSSDIRPSCFTSDYPVDESILVDGTINPRLLRIDSRDIFFPFGMVPNVGHTFYFLLPEYTQKGTEVTAQVQLTPQPVVQLVWDYLGKEGWRRLGVSDGTKAFMKSGQIAFNRPNDLASGEVNGQNSYWIRARLVRGVYGRLADFIPVDPADPGKGFRLRPGTGAPNAPVITSLRLDYTAQSQSPFVLTQNGFLYCDQTSANTPNGFAPFVSVKDLPPAYADAVPSFYFGFDATFPEKPVKLYVAVAPHAFTGSVIREKRAASTSSSALPQLTWEYFNGTAWRELTVFDGTNNLTESGVLEFLTPTDVKPLAKFDLTKHYWIRALSSGNDPFDTQQLRGIFLNTIPAIQAVTVQNEILGSSNGQSSQMLRFSRTPVLPGQQVMVREPERPSEEECAVIPEEVGNDDARPAADETEIWVRWHEVANFFRSGPDSRHYTLDRTTGLITFGDGKHGLIPQHGTNNITATYRVGGGAPGNQPKGAVSQVVSPLPGIAGVTNPVAADGGAAAEMIRMVDERGPQTLKHRYRAVSCTDLEWLARQAAGTRVARIKCMPNVNRNLCFEPGWVTLIIIPQGTGAKLSPGSELIRKVKDYLKTCAFAGLAEQTPARVNIIGPGYIQVAVTAGVVPTDIDKTEQVKKQIMDELAAFFHPLKGGPDGKGWKFGRDVYESEISKVLEDISGVSHLKWLELIPNIVQHRITLASAPTAVMDFPEGSAVITTDKRKAALLAEPLQMGASVNRIAVKGFKEGDRITKVLDLKVTTVDETKLDVTAIDGEEVIIDAVGFPRGSIVATFDGMQRTRLAEGVTPNKAITQIMVEDGDFVKPGDVLTIFYPFPMTIASVKVETITPTVHVQSVSESTITVLPFNSGAAGLPDGSPVMTSDTMRHTYLAEDISPNQTGLTQVIVQDASFAASFESGDLLIVDVPVQTLGIEPYETEIPFSNGSLFATLDNRVRMPLLAGASPDPANQKITSLKLHNFLSGEYITVSRRDRASELQNLTVQNVEPVNDIVYLDDNFLVYSGAHQITMTAEQKPSVGR